MEDARGGSHSRAVSPSPISDSFSATTASRILGGNLVPHRQRGHAIPVHRRLLTRPSVRTGYTPACRKAPLTVINGP